MPLQRTTSSTLPIPTDNTAIPAPLLTFKIIPKTQRFPTGGLKSVGSIKFNLKNTIMVNLATEAFEKFSVFKGNFSALNNFLLSLSTTSSFEGGFDGVNTYDRAGISIGFIQFARPEAGAGKLFLLTGRMDLVEKIKKLFGTSDPHSSASAIAARNDKSLLSEIVSAATTSDGMKAQFAMAINQNVQGQLYFDKAFKRFTDLNLKDPLCTAMLFDAAVNMGAGTVNNFNKPVTGQSDGDWMAAHVNLFTQPERKKGWQRIIASNFV